MKIILASRSPRRLHLLQSAGFSVEVCPSHIDETALPDESVQQMVERLCQAKAMAYQQTDDTPIIAADTLVCLHGQALGQPDDLAHAKHMLQQLSGQEHEVFTAVCVRLHEHMMYQRVRTGVRFRQLDEAEIDTYLLHNDVLDKAGAYAIQAGAASFIEAIDGPLDNVIGLPVRATLNMIADIKNLGLST
ncbi:MAG: septum formation protein Maf [Mariprofundus sp.]|nr:septum formation protein Maf [Mariprofundus sp.]